MLNNRLTAAAFAAILLGSAFGVAQAQSGPQSFVGHWHWNRAASSGTPGEQQAQQAQQAPPRDLSLNVAAADPGHVEWTMTETDTQGAKHTQSFTGTGDGRPAPIQGNQLNSTASFTVKGGMLAIVFSSPDGGSDHLSCGLSANGAQMTCRGTESDNKGHSEDYVDVYDRQQ